MIPDIINIQLLGVYASTEEVNAVGLSTALLNLMPFSIMAGTNGALETFLNQCHGSKQYSLAGQYLNTARIILISAFLPLSLILWFSDSILIFFKQDFITSNLANTYLQILIPGLLFQFLFDIQKRLLQAFKLQKYLMLITLFTSFTHYITARVLIEYYDMGIIGAAIATSSTYIINYILSMVLTYFQPVVSLTSIGVSIDGHKFRTLIKVGFYNFMMGSFKFWSYQYIILLSAYIGMIEQTVLITLFMINNLLLSLAIGVSTSFSQLIGSSIGGKRYNTAKNYVVFVYQLYLPISLFMFLIIFIGKGKIVQMLSKDEIFIEKMLQFIDLMIIALLLDYLSMFQMGIIRGIGLYQKSVIAYFFGFAILLSPLATLQLLIFNQGQQGIWTSLIATFVFINICYALIIWGLNFRFQFYDGNNTIKLEKQVKCQQQQSTQNIDENGNNQFLLIANHTDSLVKKDNIQSIN
ncbi:na+-driven multidrug efflux pump [Stylonychia lemnae]|uniref:Na+-driven multidrug efflux pump n=1 Tax=Stylonychia lemnae TaxID=5949 RepID=A0A077ZQM3_STYLE|nr:na+-driven multidrug efflux pump [Stylonychia lemnae]|eukprot:CDW71680.1 na+-driven multidrug efflux pump [Stylonychia lemnae]